MVSKIGQGKNKTHTQVKILKKNLDIYNYNISSISQKNYSREVLKIGSSQGRREEEVQKTCARPGKKG
jgi:hypothetical protein